MQNNSDNLPTKTEMLKNVIKTAKDAFKQWLSDGSLFSDDKVAKERIAICLDCEHITEDNRCSVCGCHLEAKVKVQISSCPKGKW